jgi:hypothetical protein
MATKTVARLVSTLKQYRISLVYIPSYRRKKVASQITILRPKARVYVRPFKLLNQMTDFHKTGLSVMLLQDKLTVYILISYNQ